MPPASARHVRQRPHRLSRTAYRGEIAVSYTACVAHRFPLFGNPTTTNGCIRILGTSAQDKGCVVPIYCFMPDHVHIILQGMSPTADSWAAMVDFKQRTGFWMKRQGLSVAWQRGFYDRVLRDEAAIKAQLRYIAGNPVRRKLASTWDVFPFTGSFGVELAEVA